MTELVISQDELTADGTRTDDGTTRTLLGAVHLLCIDDGLDEMRRHGACLALCGAMVPAGVLPSSLCPPDCQCSVYCPDCVRTAAVAVGLSDDQAHDLAGPVTTAVGREQP